MFSQHDFKKKMRNIKVKAHPSSSKLEKKQSIGMENSRDSVR